MPLEPIVHFNEMQAAGYGKDSRAVKALCATGWVPYYMSDRIVVLAQIIGMFD